MNFKWLSDALSGTFCAGGFFGSLFSAVIDCFIFVLASFAANPWIILTFLAIASLFLGTFFNDNTRSIAKDARFLVTRFTFTYLVFFTLVVVIHFATI